MEAILMIEKIIEMLLMGSVMLLWFGAVGYTVWDIVKFIWEIVTETVKNNNTWRT